MPKDASAPPEAPVDSDPDQSTTIHRAVPTASFANPAEPRPPGAGSSISRPGLSRGPGQRGSTRFGWLGPMSSVRMRTAMASHTGHAGRLRHRRRTHCALWSHEKRQLVGTHGGSLDRSITRGRLTCKPCGLGGRMGNLRPTEPLNDRAACRAESKNRPRGLRLGCRVRLNRTSAAVSRIHKIRNFFRERGTTKPPRSWGGQGLRLRLGQGQGAAA